MLSILILSTELMGAPCSGGLEFLWRQLYRASSADLRPVVVYRGHDPFTPSTTEPFSSCTTAILPRSSMLLSTRRYHHEFRTCQPVVGRGAEGSSKFLIAVLDAGTQVCWTTCARFGRPVSCCLAVVPASRSRLLPDMMRLEHIS